MNEFVLSLIEDLDVKQRNFIPEQKPEVINTIEGIKQNLTAKNYSNEQIIALETFAQLIKNTDKNKDTIKTEHSYSNDKLITKYTDFIRYYFNKVFKEETVNDIYVSAILESFVSMAEQLIEKGLLPEKIYMTQEDADLYLSTIESSVKANLENYNVNLFLKENYHLNDIDPSVVKHIIDSVKYYTMSLDAIFNFNNALLRKDVRELLLIYQNERDSLFDYLVGKYIISELV
jgi:hypothetical protein